VKERRAKKYQTAISSGAHTKRVHVEPFFSFNFSVRQKEEIKTHAGPSVITHKKENKKNYMCVD
jgi:hypothetical protein